MSKQNYFIPDNHTNFDAEWLPVEAQLKTLLPLKDISGAVVEKHTQILSIDFSKVVYALNNAPDTTGLIDRFFTAVKKKNAMMTVEELLSRTSAEITRWRKMGNKITLLPNALVLHMNSLQY